MNITPNVPKLDLSERIAAHLVDFPLNKKCVKGEPSDQLLNDVLNNLRVCYQGAYSDFVPPPLFVAAPIEEQTPLPETPFSWR